jgi:hypothetical protein
MPYTLYFIVFCYLMTPYSMRSHSKPNPEKHPIPPALVVAVQLVSISDVEFESSLA